MAYVTKSGELWQPEDFDSPHGLCTMVGVQGQLGASSTKQPLCGRGLGAVFAQTTILAVVAVVW